MNPKIAYMYESEVSLELQESADCEVNVCIATLTQESADQCCTVAFPTARCFLLILSLSQRGLDLQTSLP